MKCIYINFWQLQNWNIETDGSEMILNVHKNTPFACVQSKKHIVSFST